VLEKFRHEINYCTFCPKLCRFSCPVTNAETRETVTPTTKLNFLYLLQNGHITPSKEVAEIFYHCAGCLTCRAYCKHRIDVPEIIEAARRYSVEHGIQPQSLEKHIRTFAASRNPYGDSLRDKLNALNLTDRINKPAKAVYFIGCTTMFHYPDVARATVSLLSRCGIDFAVYGGDSLCCGSPALFSGDHKSFLDTAKHNAELLNQYETVITGCPSCMAALKIKYKDNGIELKPEVVHTSELLLKHVESGRIALERSFERVMYHDPCHLAKYFGIYEEPRELINRMFFPDNVIEFSWNKDKNYCCGGGGLLPITVPKVSRAITNERLTEFNEAKADILINACPTCRRTFSRADSKVKSADIVSLVLEHIKD
jgi:Fe-S oxidoreductase